MAGSKSSSESSRGATTTLLAVGVVALVVFGAGGVVALGVQAPTASDGPTSAANASETPTSTPTPAAETDDAPDDAGTDGNGAASSADSSGSDSDGDDSSDADSSGDGASDADSAATDSSGASTSATEPARPFSLTIGNMERCGQTCRDVTVTLTNNGEDPRTGVAVTTTMYAGETAGENQVWTSEASIGRLGPGASTTRTERVKVGFLGGAKIKQNGGTVTVQTVVRWDGGSVTFTERKQVA